MNKTIPPAIIAIINTAKTVNQISIYLIYLAIVLFLLFGTLKSLPKFHDNTLIYHGFYYISYSVIGLTIPLSCFVAFILYRYRLSQPGMIVMCLAVGFGLFFISSYVAFASWIGVAFMFKANLKRFFSFLQEQHTEISL
ncbi:hypothetical protein MOMA_02430 [Moraxella macacae 0408225]|uniref:Uncharacterized protein n=1 Tax=Moraxella macacae 0408225 TaxID=1230338 RepID=L2F8J8_9GAMM|nr:hypothetical protein [Moraxella macacae]ELA09225.1 hypothetical protein MOMA_02430 [Moraxella macacae 0408225]